MTQERIDQLIRTYRDGLLNDTVPFWLRHSIDREHGGYMFSVDRDGRVIDTDKSVWLQGRFAWLLATLYNTVEPRQEWLDGAALGVDFLLKHGYDRDGKMYFHLTREGRPIRMRRYAVSESFAAIAYAALAKATKDEALADKARQMLHQFYRYNTTPGMIPPKFADTRPMKSIGFFMILINTAQEVRDSIGDPRCNEYVDFGISEIKNFFLKEDQRVVMENVGLKGEIYDHFDGRILNPGHAIEASWFVMHEGMLRRDANLIATGSTMLDWMWERGWDKQYGGILYFRDLNDLPVQEYWQDMKFWWPQNEAIIATLLAYGLTREAKYAEWHKQIHDWTYERFPDPEYGEWFGYLHRDGRLANTLKGNLWKGGFHIPRMQLYCWKLLERMRSGSLESLT
jgi:N-acylglucosamine 2-epimerase